MPILNRLPEIVSRAARLEDLPQSQERFKYLNFGAANAIGLHFLGQFDSVVFLQFVVRVFLVMESILMA